MSGCKWSQRGDLNSRPTDYEFLAILAHLSISKEKCILTTLTKADFRSSDGDRRRWFS